MLLILSARPVNDDISMQLGKIPPSFLPLGGRRLFHWQAELAGPQGCALTVPQDYEIRPRDQAALQSLGVRVLPQDPTQSLTEALAAALRTLQLTGPVQVLLGDTFVDLDAGQVEATDLVAVQDTTANYPWGFVDTEGPEMFSDEPPRALAARRVICGYFAFSDSELLVRCCARGSFIKALNAYHSERPLDLRRVPAWHDFGHLPLYFQSQRRAFVKRVFNELSVEKHHLIKCSEDTRKARAEAAWYENLPEPMRLYTPRYLGRHEHNYLAGYTIEYVYKSLVADLWSFADLPLATWLEILSGCFEFLDSAHEIHPPPGAPEAGPAFASHFFDAVFVSKTWERLERYCTGAGIGLDTRVTINGRCHAPLGACVQRAIAALRPTSQADVRFWHGDFFFGNIFYDFTARRVVAIDPRGQIEPGEFSLYGDRRYDLAKLAHSVIGHYDRMQHGRAILVEHGANDWSFEAERHPEHAQIEDVFCDYVRTRCGLDPAEIYAATALLFFSMLPLHGDKPEMQKQFLATALLLSERLEARRPSRRRARDAKQAGAAGGRE